jgi:hypothetical protein
MNYGKKGEKPMKTLIRIVLLFALFCGIGGSLVARATSFNPLIEEHRQLKEKLSMKTSALVYLFHSGTPDVKKALAINDILIVYRGNSSCEMKEVAKIKILSNPSDNYVKGEVIKGEITEGDIAKKGSVGFLVIFPEEICLH